MTHTRKTTDHDPSTTQRCRTRLFPPAGCGQKAELVFVVDCSGSVGPLNFKLQQEFLSDMIKPLHIGELPVENTA